MTDLLLKINLVPRTRIELVMAGYQPTVIPFNYKRNKLIRGDYRGSNPNYQSHSLGCYHYNIATPKKSYTTLGVP